MTSLTTMLTKICVKLGAMLATKVGTILVTSIVSIVGCTFVMSNNTTVSLGNIGELATQAGYYMNVQTIEEASELWGWEIPMTDSKYIFSYNGVVKAGIDFTDIQFDIDKADKKITVTMPEIRILSNEVDPNSFRIYHEKDNIFNPLNISDMNMSFTNLKEEGEAYAIEMGMIDNARANAEALINGILVTAYDLKKYEVVYVWPDISENQSEQ